MHTLIYPNMCAHTIYASVHVCIPVHTCMCVYLCTCIYMYIHVYSCTQVFFPHLHTCCTEHPKGSTCHTCMCPLWAVNLRRLAPTYTWLGEFAITPRHLNLHKGALCWHLEAQFLEAQFNGVGTCSLHWHLEAQFLEVQCNVVGSLS